MRHLSKPSDSWSGFDGYSEVHWILPPVRKLLDKIDLDALRGLGTSLRGGVTCSISPQFTFGTENLVRELVFVDGIVWIARLGLFYEHPAIISSQVVTMRYVKKLTTIPIPEVYHYDTDENNPVGCQYILMEAVSGCAAADSPHGVLLNLPNDKIDKVCAQLADIILQLSRLEFPEIGSLQQAENGDVYIGNSYPIYKRLDTLPKFSSTADYFKAIVFAKHSKRQTINNMEWLARSEFSYSLRTCIASNFITCERKLFPLTHPDFHARNILFDDDYNITAVLDWNRASTAPWEVFCNVPGGWYLYPAHEIERIDRVDAMQRVDVMRRLRERFIVALKAAEAKEVVSHPKDIRLSEIFEDPNTRKALAFSVHYLGYDKELFEWAFGEAGPLKLDNYRDALFANTKFKGYVWDSLSIRTEYSGGKGSRDIDSRCGC